jgi:biopolymer transport protein ExbD
MPKVQAASDDSGGRGRRRPRVASNLSEINVVPLVDVMLVLLIIFMVTAPMMQRGVEVNLPTARRTQTLASEPLFVTVPLTYRAQKIVYLGNEPIRVEVLNERMRQAMQNRQEKEVFLRGDGGVQLQELLDIMGRLKDGGVEKVGIVAKDQK